MEVYPVPQSDFSPQELEAIWFSYQNSGGADCPHCEGSLTVALNEHPIDGQKVAPSIVVACRGCQHSSHDFPRNHAIWA